MTFVSESLRRSSVKYMLPLLQLLSVLSQNKDSCCGCVQTDNQGLLLVFNSLSCSQMMSLPVERTTCYAGVSRGVTEEFLATDL